SVFADIGYGGPYGRRRRVQGQSGQALNMRCDPERGGQAGRADAADCDVVPAFVAADLEILELGCGTKPGIDGGDGVPAQCRQYLRATLAKLFEGLGNQRGVLALVLVFSGRADQKVAEG